MRSRRSDIRSRRSALCAWRSARLSFGPGHLFAPGAGLARRSSAQERPGLSCSCPWRGRRAWGSGVPSARSSACRGRAAPSANHRRLMRLRRPRQRHRRRLSYGPATSRWPGYFGAGLPHIGLVSAPACPTLARVGAWGADLGVPARAPALRVLVAPDSYGDSLTAVQAAAAIAAGWNRARPDDQLTLAPQSDGGPGFVAVLAARLGGLQRLRVCGPLDADGPMSRPSGSSIPRRQPPTWSARRPAA